MLNTDFFFIHLSHSCASDVVRGLGIKCNSRICKLYLASLTEPLLPSHAHLHTYRRTFGASVSLSIFRAAPSSIVRLFCIWMIPFYVKSYLGNSSFLTLNENFCMRQRKMWKCDGWHHCLHYVHARAVSQVPPWRKQTELHRLVGYLSHNVTLAVRRRAGVWDE